MNVLAIIDAQNEFIDGALGSKEAATAVDKIVTEINKGYDKIIMTNDTHDKNYLKTQEGKNLPITHGQRGTYGYEINSKIIDAINSHYFYSNVYTVRKPSFGSIEFGEYIKELYEKAVEKNEPLEVYFAGFCTGICVLSNVVIAKTFAPEAIIYVIKDACACVTPETHKTALNAMTPIQVNVI